jgi:hypothetical protein
VKILNAMPGARDDESHSDPAWRSSSDHGPTWRKICWKQKPLYAQAQLYGKRSPATLEARAKGGEEDTSKDEKNSSEEKNTKIFSNLLDRKVSIFSKKNAKSPEVLQAPSSSDLRPLDEREWTIL